MYSPGSASRAKPEGRCLVNTSHNHAKQVDNILISQLVRFSNAKRFNLIPWVWAGEYEQGNTSRVNIYCIVLLYLSAIVSTPHSLLQSKPPQTFQTVNNDQGLCNIPLKRTKETETSKGQITTVRLSHCWRFRVLAFRYRQRRNYGLCGFHSIHSTSLESNRFAKVT